MHHTTPHAKPLAAYKVTKPLLGVDLYAQDNYSAAVTTELGTRTLLYIKNVLKANAVGLLWNLYSPGRNSNKVGPRASSMSAANIMILTKIAQHLGLKVEYRPLVFVPSHPVNPWEGLISPPSQKIWINNYFKALLPYARAAQKTHINELVAETELHLLNGSPLWGSFFNRVRAIYKGVTSYSAWQGDYLPPTGHLLPVRLYGMDMYKQVKLPYNASSARVTAAWEKIFSTTPAAILKRTALDEEGIEARRGAYLRPPNLGTPGIRDDNVQANWFTAACKTVAKYHMRGVYFFKVDLTDNPAEPADSLSTFEGRKGALAISACAKLFR